LPLEQMLQRGGEESDDAREVHRIERPGLELVWVERTDKPDPENGRMIRTRQLTARANLVQVLITFDVYRDLSDRFEPVWKDLLRSLRVGVPRTMTGEVGN
jgi:hypothetical protein